MSKIKLNKGDEIAILNLDGTDFIMTCPPDPADPYTLMPENKTVEPDVELYTMKDDEDVDIDANHFIKDANNAHAWSIISPRPRNITRR